MPSALRTKFTPQKIEEVLVTKIHERSRNNNPLSTLHKLFKKGEKNTQTITREDMQNLFRKFSILTSKEDFDNFYSWHDRGDGLIDIRSFLLRLIPQPDHASNPLAPKAPRNVSTELHFANQLAELTGRRREISSINGVSSIRFEKVADTDSGDAESASLSRPISAYDVRGSKIENYTK